MNKKIGIIVDGLGDFTSLRTRFLEGYKILKTDGPRGHTALVDSIAKQSRKQVGILAAYQCDRVIVLLDFEERAENYKIFVSRLKNAFTAQAFPMPVSVAVPNTMIENWYLADIEHLCTQKAFLKNKIKQKHFEGIHGKNEIKRYMRKNDSYSETKHGPQLFEILRFEDARKYSASFDDFLNQL